MNTAKNIASTLMWRIPIRVFRRRRVHAIENENAVRTKIEFFMFHKAAVIHSMRSSLSLEPTRPKLSGVLAFRVLQICTYVNTAKKHHAFFISTSRAQKISATTSEAFNSNTFIQYAIGVSRRDEFPQYFDAIKLLNI